MTKDTHAAMAAGLLNCAVQIELQQRHMSRVIATNRALRAHIHRSRPCIEYDVKTKVAQIANKDMFIFVTDHNL